MALQLSQSLRVKEQGSSDFAEEFLKNNTEFLKNNTILVINCSGNIHTSETIFHFNCAIMISDGLVKTYFTSKGIHSNSCHSCVVILKIL